jgi:hypothetical protein
MVLTSDRQSVMIRLLYTVFASCIPKLSELVDRETLRELSDQVITILQDCCSLSPVLEEDAEALRAVRTSI